jgi:hypothetical protein
LNVARFTTITGADWARELPLARARRRPAAVRARLLAGMRAAGASAFTVYLTGPEQRKSELKPVPVLPIRILDEVGGIG